MIKVIRNKRSTENAWNYLRISNWVFYFCGVASFSLAFGIAAILEDQDMTQYPICVLFSAACVFSAAMMITQGVWQIKYNSQELIFRNSFGISKKYNMKDLAIVEDKRMTRIVFNGNTIIRWDSSIMNINEEIALHKAFRHMRCAE